MASLTAHHGVSGCTLTAPRRPGALPPRCMPLRLRCTATGPGSSDPADHPKDRVGMEQIAQKLLHDDAEAQARFSRVSDAAAKVAALRAQQAEVQQAMDAAAAAQAQTSEEQQRQIDAANLRVTEAAAAAQVLAARAALEAAELEVAVADLDRQKWANEVNEDLEKLESGKAAAVAALGGGIGSLPYLLTAGHAPTSTLLSVGAALASCVLFGVTFRYALRQDLGNLQLKGGVVAAFGLVRGLALADALQLAAADSGGNIFDAEFISKAGLAAGESMLLFGFAAAALEVAFQRGVVKPFGMASADEILPDLINKKTS